MPQRHGTTGARETLALDTLLYRLCAREVCFTLKGRTDKGINLVGEKEREGVRELHRSQRARGGELPVGYYVENLLGHEIVVVRPRMGLHIPPLALRCTSRVESG